MLSASRAVRVIMVSLLPLLTLRTSCNSRSLSERETQDKGGAAGAGEFGSFSRLGLQKSGLLPQSFHELARIRVSFEDSQHGWFADSYRLWRTEDGGKSWKNVYSGNESGYALKYECVGKNGLWVITGKGIHKSR
jgi:hypothetical protein